jgi:DNA-binding NarL/FixJ family response regulator
VTDKEDTAKILIVDANALFRMAVKEMISNSFPALQIIEAISYDDALSQIARHHPAMVMLDLNINGPGGLELTQRIRSENSDIALAVMSTNEYAEYRKQAMECGANYFLSKSAPSGPKILRAIDEQFDQ